MPQGSLSFSTQAAVLCSELAQAAALPLMLAAAAALALLLFADSDVEMPGGYTADELADTSPIKVDAYD